jgi:hypothetical protein
MFMLPGEEVRYEFFFWFEGENWSLRLRRGFTDIQQGFRVGEDQINVLRYACPDIAALSKFLAEDEALGLLWEYSSPPHVSVMALQFLPSDIEWHRLDDAQDGTPVDAATD